METKLLTVSEAARRLGVSRPTVLRAIKAGKLRTVVLHRQRYVPAEELLRFLGFGGLSGGEKA